ncbi:hypothetical protein GCM10027612_10300 [Microbispora bryophytorum subsp. camponoti]
MDAAGPFMRDARRVKLDFQAQVYLTELHSNVSRHSAGASVCTDDITGPERTTVGIEHNMVTVLGYRQYGGGQLRNSSLLDCPDQ